MPEEFVPSLGAIESPTDYRDIPLSVAGGEIVPTSYKTDISALPVWNQRKKIYHTCPIGHMWYIFLIVCSECGDAVHIAMPPLILIPNVHMFLV
jgi:hypothetical protein